MKVTAIIIKLDPAKNETNEPRELIRTPDKRWSSKDGNGLFSGEVKLAAGIEEAISRWGG